MAFQPGNHLAGSRKGVPNKRTEELDAALRAAGMQDGDCPAVYLYRVYSGRQRFERYIEGVELNPATGAEEPCSVKVLEPATEQVRVQAAIACAKYVHPALKAVDVTSNGETLGAPLFGEDFRKLAAEVDRMAPLPALPAHPKPAAARKGRAARVE